MRLSEYIYAVNMAKLPSPSEFKVMFTHITREEVLVGRKKKQEREEKQTSFMERTRHGCINRLAQ